MNESEWSEWSRSYAKPAAKPRTVVMRIGGVYRTRGGDVVKITHQRTGTESMPFTTEFSWVGYKNGTAAMVSYRDDGTYGVEGAHPNDLVDEQVDGVAAAPAMMSGPKPRKRA